MRRKQVGQLGWVDAALRQRRSRGRDKLSEISRLLDWEPFEVLLSRVYSSNQGEPAYPPLLMFKALLLQRWYELSDPGMEEALEDRLSFRRFVGLALEDDTPDHTTIHRFRDRLAAKRLTEPLLAELMCQLDGLGVVLKQGTLIDASLVRSAAKRPRGEGVRVSSVDPDARFGTNNENKRFEFGYKLHVAVDQGSGLVRALKLSSANVQDIDLATALVQGDEAALYADRAYDAQRLHDYLAEAGIANAVMRRGRRGKPLSLALKERNNWISSRRRQVEKLFGTLKRSYGLARTPYFNMARTHLAVTLACFAFNLRRLHVLTTG